MLYSMYYVYYVNQQSIHLDFCMDSLEDAIKLLNYLQENIDQF